MKDDNDLNSNYNGPFGETEEKKDEKRIDEINKNENADKHAAEVDQKLKVIKIMLHARSFEKAAKMISELEESEEKLLGYCGNSEIYWCKVLLKYQARDEADLISKSPDIEDDENYILAVDFCTSDEQKQHYQSIAAQISVAKEQACQRQAEEERKEEKARINSLLNMGDYNDIGGGYVTFGSYPQSKKLRNVIIGEEIDKERSYYLGSDNCLYVEWNGEYYKIEPIKWKVLSRGSECCVVSDMILDQHCFDGGSNNYANSEIRGWLNSEFYNKAFRDGQKSKIVTTNVNNSLSSTCDSSNRYTCGNTSDKVFLLSHKEAVQYFSSDFAHQKIGTDYAKDRNLLVNSSNGNSWWWLRSPYYCGSIFAQVVGYNGVFDYYCVIDDRYGVVPALKIKL